MSVHTSSTDVTPHTLLTADGVSVTPGTEHSHLLIRAHSRKQPAWLACVRYSELIRKIIFPLSKEKSGKNLPNHGLEIWMPLEGGISPVP